MAVSAAGRFKPGSSRPADRGYSFVPVEICSQVDEFWGLDKLVIGHWWSSRSIQLSSDGHYSWRADSLGLSNARHF